MWLIHTLNMQPTVRSTKQLPVPEVQLPKNYSSPADHSVQHYHLFLSLKAEAGSTQA
jgi:hypothetical protein